MGSNRAHTLLLVIFVSVITLTLSTNYVIAATAPTADAGDDQVVNEGDTIQLDGSRSDVTGAATPYSWAYTSGPNPSPFAGAPCSGGSCTVSPDSFTAFVAKPGNAVMNFTLTVTNGTGVDTDFMLVTIMGTAHKHDFTPGENGKFKENLGQIITGKAFGVEVGTPGALVSGSLKNLVVTTTVDDIDVDFDFTESNSIPPGLALPDILTALFLDLGFFLAGTTTSAFTQTSDLSTNEPAILQFTIKNDFASSKRFADGCPVMSLQLLDETTAAWGAVGDPERANAHKIYVSNSDLNTVSVIDGSTNNLLTPGISSISVGDTPKSLSYDNSTNRVYVANSGAVPGTVSVIDTAGDANTVIATIIVGTTPSSVAVNESTSRVYVTNSGSGTISVINTANNEIEGTITLVGTAPNSVAVNEATDRIYVTNGTLLVIDTAGDANNIINKITVGTAPSSVAVNESANGVYVANKDDGTVSVYNATTNTVVATITVGTDPTGLSFNPTTKKLYVANSGSNDVSVIDTEINMKIATVTPVTGAFDVEANPSTNRIFVANSGAGTVSVIDGILGTTTENTVIDTITGFSSNFGIALNPTIPNPVRDPSADASYGVDQCAYIATPPHFSKFAIGGIKALALGALVASGGGGGGGSAPSFSDSTVASFGTGSDGFGVILSDTNQNLLENTATLSTGEKNMFRFDLVQYRGINGLAHVGFFLNLRGDDFMAQKWDTYITFDKGEPLQVVDPNGYFSEVDFKILEKDATNLVLKYEITFAKPMEKSHLLLKAWDTYRTGSNNLLLDAIEVVEGEKQTTTDESELLSDESGLLSDEPQLQETEISAELFESLDEAREALNEAKAIPVWIKTSAGWWSEKKISDSDFVLGIEFLIKNDVITVPQVESEIKSSPQIPDWISVNAGWWANEQISDEEFTQSLQWLIANGVMTI